MTSDQNDPHDDDLTSHYLYEVILSVEHPIERPERITHEFGLAIDDPISSAYAAVAVTWSHTVKIRSHRLFFAIVIGFLTCLETAGDFVQALIASGGRITIWVRLPGSINIGDVLDAQDLARMARLKVELGVTMVPHLQSEPALQTPYPRAQPGPASA